MKKKILISLIVLLAIMISLGIAVFIYANQVESVTERTGKFFDEFGKELGTCKIEATLTRLADAPKYRTYYYSSDEQYTGYCEGPSVGCGSSSKLQQDEHQICTSASLQTQCEKLNGTVSRGAKSKYQCITQ